MDLYAVLDADGEDSLFELVEYNPSRLVFEVCVDVLGGKRYRVTMSNPVHLDMPPKVALGSMSFGDSALLPKGYAATRNKGNDGDEHAWRVIRVVDDETNEFYAIAYAGEVFEDGKV